MPAATSSWVRHFPGHSSGKEPPVTAVPLLPKLPGTLGMAQSLLFMLQDLGGSGFVQGNKWKTEWCPARVSESRWAAWELSLCSC